MKTPKDGRGYPAILEVGAEMFIGLLRRSAGESIEPVPVRPDITSERLSDIGRNGLRGLAQLIPMNQ